MVKKTKQKQPPKKQSQAQQPKSAPKSTQIKRETVWLIAFVCLVVGFVGGVTFGVYKLGNVQAVAHPEGEGGMPSAAPAAGPQNADTLRMIGELEAQVKQNPENLEAWTHLGHLYFDTDQVDQAITAYNQALELEKDNPDVWTDLGVMYRRAKRPQDAIEAFKQAITLNPKHEIARYNTGVVLLHDLNDTEGALKAWDALMAINPEAKGPGGTPIKEMVEQMKKGNS